jgi:DNA-binding transcriptional ArsR family regulator
VNDLGKLFKALADPTRVRILTHLAKGDLCVGALAQRLGVTHSAVSQHLRILREAGLVDGDKRGYWVHYSLDRKQIGSISAKVAKWLERLSSSPVGKCVDTRRCPRRGEAAAGKSGTKRR